MRIAALALFALVAPPLAPSIASAQRRLAHDTLSDSTPTAVTCGFCVTEGFGVVFRELPAPAVGLGAGDFPVTLHEVQLALASAHTTGTGPYQCTGVAGGGMADADVEIWAGVTPPTGSIRTMPGPAEPWATDETLVWAATVPITLSEPDAAAGPGRFTLNLNRLPIVGEMGETLVIPPPATYLRVVVWFTAGGASTLCDSAMLEPPAGVPVRDDDGRIAPERGFLYAAGTGWLWSEEAGIQGDWGLRLLVTPTSTPRDAGMIGDVDAGSAGTDAAMEADSGAIEADAGAPTGGGGGCSCRVARRGQDGVVGLAAALALAALALAAMARRRARWS